jgi:predicted esterase
MHACAAMLLGAGLCLATAAEGHAPEAAETSPPVELVPQYPRATSGAFPFGAERLGPWREHVPGIESVVIPSTADGKKQHALFFDPHQSGPRPLLVVLHSWSESYLQNIGIPYGVFAEKNGWVLVAPDHRGPYRTPEATASELAQQDVLDAIDYAKRRADVDPARVYLVGYSGSAMMSLVLAGKHPEEFGGVVAWVPVYDLVDWYAWLEENGPTRHYVHDVEVSCGGPPVPGSAAAEECKERSPSTWLSNARGRVNILIGAGIWDHLVPPDQALRAFDDLASPEDRIGDEMLAKIDETRSIPPDLEGSPPSPLFAKAGVKGLFSRTSEKATVVVFQGSHDLVYNAGLAWLADQRRD